MVNVKVIVAGLLSVVLIVLALCSTTTEAASVSKRAATICQPGARCGWFVYNKNTRRLEDAHKACDCPAGEECIRAEDDISISAFVYRCGSTAEQEQQQHVLPTQE